MNKFNGYNISYDKNGNPLVYRDGMSFSWENGRNLKTVRMQNDSFINMKYDINGMRTSKVQRTEISDIFMTASL